MDREAGVSPPAARERVPERVAPASLAKWGPVHALCSTRNGVGNGAVSRCPSVLGQGTPVGLSSDLGSEIATVHTSFHPGLSADRRFENDILFRRNQSPNRIIGLRA
jgi:hypothetical protein